MYKCTREKRIKKAAPPMHPHQGPPESQPRRHDGRPPPPIAHAPACRPATGTCRLSRPGPRTAQSRAPAPAAGGGARLRRASGSLRWRAGRAASPLTHALTVGRPVLASGGTPVLGRRVKAAAPPPPPPPPLLARCPLGPRSPPRARACVAVREGDGRAAAGTR